MDQDEKREQHRRLASKRELHLLANVYEGRRRDAPKDTRSLARWSEQQLNDSLNRQ